MLKTPLRLILGALAAGVLSTTALAADTGARDTKPAEWSGDYTWYDYSKTAEQPVSRGKVAPFEVEYYVEGMHFDSLPLQHAIVRVRGNGEKKIAVFSDPLCPHSRVLERSLNALDNVTIYTFVVPLLNKDPQSNNWKLSETIQCQPSNQAQAQAYDAWLVDGIPPNAVAGCETSIKAVLATLTGVENPDGQYYSDLSPLSVFDNGLAVTGGIPPGMLKQILAVPKQKPVS